MSLTVTTNLPSIAAQKTLNTLNRGLERGYAQLSTGSRITRAADDAAVIDQ